MIDDRHRPPPRFIMIDVNMARVIIMAVTEVGSRIILSVKFTSVYSFILHVAQAMVLKGTPTFLLVFIHEYLY
jgi:hypothetical protein